MSFFYKGYTSVNQHFIVNGPQCYCGCRDWFRRSHEEWVCSQCQNVQKVSVKGYITDGPLCKCGYRDWFVGKEIVRCTNCSDKIFIKYASFIVDGPICKCNNRDWFESETTYKCSNCKNIIIKFPT
ncbi:MAG: hypothetical protein N2449_06490 [Bacteroidales bacterium]|nr:hypothetical protein [Bacteroidales bacterium]